MKETKQDWRLVPPALAAWGGAWLGTSGQCSDIPSLALLGLVAGVLSLIGRRRWWRLALLILVVTTSLAGIRESALRTGTLADLAADGSQVGARIQLVGDAYRPPGRGDGLTIQQAKLLELTVAERRFTTHVPIVVLGSRQAGELMAGLDPGATVEIRGRLRPEAPGNPTAAAIFVQQVVGTLSPPGAVDRAVTAIRTGLRTASSGLPPDQAGLVPSLVLGDRSAVTVEVQEQFRATSLTHLMAVSGANLTLLLGVLIATAQWVGVRGWGIRGVAALGVLAFVFVCRAEPSVLRAAVMGLIALPAVGIGSGGRSLRNLGLAVLTLTALDPWLARSWGFALSVAACAGIVLLGERVVASLSRWVPNWLAEAVAVPFAAQLATLPLTVELSGRISLSGVLANVAAGPFVGPATVLGLIAALLWWWPWAAAGVAGLAGVAVQPILMVAKMAAGLPSGSLPWPRGVTGVLASVMLVLLAIWLVPRLADHGLLALFVAGAVVLASFLPRLPPGPWTVAFCDVGQGDATVLRAGQEEAVLVDTGPEPRLVLACLAELGVSRIPLVVFTHYHQDHVGGAAEVLERFRPDLVVVSPLPSPPDAAAEVEQAAREVGAEMMVATPGLSRQVGELSWQVLSAWQPPMAQADDETESVVENDSSVVSVAETGGIRVLLPGDIELDGQTQLLREVDRLHAELQVDVYKLPHHGAAKQNLELLHETGARMAVVSAGRGNGYGHPAQRTVQAAVEAGMVVVRTDQLGLIMVSSTTSGLRVMNRSR